MKYLLDTQALIWCQDDPTRLTPNVAAILNNPVYDLFLSIASACEIGIKVALGKLRLSKPFRIWVEAAIKDLILTDMPLTLAHVERQVSLPFHHKDPFDRILAAQSLVEGIPIISIDTQFDTYGVSRIWS